MHETAVDKLELHLSNATTPVSTGQQHISISPEFTWAVQRVFTIERKFFKKSLRSKKNSFASCDFNPAGLLF